MDQLCSSKLLLPQQGCSVFTLVLDGEALKFHSFGHGSAALTSYNASVLDCTSLKLLSKFLLMSICVPVWGMYTGECGHPWLWSVEEAMGSSELELQTAVNNPIRVLRTKQRSFPTEVLSFNCGLSHRPGAQVR